MVEIIKNGVTYPIKSELSEISLREMDKLVNIYNNKDYGAIDQRIEVIKVLGLPNDIANNLGAKALIDITTSIILKSNDKSELKPYIDIDGVRYVAYNEGEEFELTASQLSKIENIYRKGKENITSSIMAIIFQNDEVDEKGRAIIMEDKMMADVAIPYVGWINLNIVQNIEALND